VEDKKRGQLDDVNLLRVRSRSLALLAIELVDPLLLEKFMEAIPQVHPGCGLGQRQGQVGKLPVSDRLPLATEAGEN